MTRTLSWYGTSVGKKVVMGVTGIILFSYLFFHLLGNLQIYLGPDAINGYAALLHVAPHVLWVARIVLLLALGFHLLASIQLALQSYTARPVKYRKQVYEATTYAARTMMYSGPIIAAFIIYHVLHLTCGKVGPEFTHDVYANVIAGFNVWYIALFYVIAIGLLGFHLWHGTWSFFQSLGLNHPKWNQWRKVFAIAFTLFIVIGNLSIPFSVITGIVS